jgi:hypothetical protein
MTPNRLTNEAEVQTGAAQELPPLDVTPEEREWAEHNYPQMFDVEHPSRLARKSMELSCRERQIRAALLRESAALERLRVAEESFTQEYDRAESAEQELLLANQQNATYKKWLVLTDCAVCRGSGQFVDSEHGGMWAMCDCHANRIGELRQELRLATMKAEGLQSLLVASNKAQDDLAEELRLLKAEREKGFGSWIRTSDRMPVTGSLCLIVWAETVQATAYRRFGSGFACEGGYAWDAAHGEGDSIPDVEVTHWTPMPDFRSIAGSGEKENGGQS